MGKAGCIAVVLSLIGTTVFAKDKEHHKPAEPTHSAPAHTPAPAPAPAPAPSHAPAPVVKAVPSVPSSASSPRKMEDSPKPAEPRHSHPAHTTPHHEATPKMASSPAPKNSENPATQTPSGKAGTALGPLPPPKTSNSAILGQPLVPSIDKPTEHKHSSSRSTTHGSHTALPLPAAPKFETNGKIPPFGTSLSASSSPSRSPTGAKPEAGHQPPSNSQPVPKDDHDHDHHGDSHHGSGHRHSHWGGGSSWLIIGSSAPICPYGYGPGFGPMFGPGYGGYPLGGYAPVPVQTYVPTVTPVVTSVPVPAATSAPPPQPQQMTPDDFAALPVGRQRDMLLQALNALEDDFARAPNGEDWSRHLQLGAIARLVGEGDAPVDPTTRVRLRSIVELFDEVAANPDDRVISELWSFRALQGALRAFATEPIAHWRRQLSRSAAGLSKAFEAWPSGDRWKSYLQLTWLIGTEEEDRLDLDARLVQFEKALAKFDRVKSDDQYQAVTQPPAFDATHAALREFVRELESLIARTTPPSPGEQP